VKDLILRNMAGREKDAGRQYESSCKQLPGEAKFFSGDQIRLTLSEQQYFVRDTACQSTK